MPVETCDERLAGAFVKRCGYKPKQGITKKWYANWEDFDREATVLANKGTKVLLPVLKAGMKLYPAESVTTKGLKAKHALAVQDFGNGYTHTDTLVIPYNGEVERERIQELVGGARIVSIVQNVDTGVNGELTFDVFGFESGMQIIEDNFDSAANSGVTTVSVATNKGEEEGTGKKIFMLAGGVAATEAWINTNTYVAP